MPGRKFLFVSYDGLIADIAWEVVKEGEGASPKATDMVHVHYAGWLTDGTIFDNSYERGFETSFRLNQVIPGWTEGLQLMKPGAVYRFVIPPKLAYGNRAMGPVIQPNSTLVFLVELKRVGE